MWLHELRTDAVFLHQQAIHDENGATSSALAWACISLGVPHTGDLHPLVWLHSTPLMRRLLDLHREFAATAPARKDNA